MIASATGTGSGQPFINFPIHGSSFSDLLDSCVSRSLLHKNAFLLICAPLSHIPLLKKTQPVSGAPLKVLGCASLKISKRIAFDWVVLDDIAHQVVIDADVLVKLQAEMNYSNHTLTLLVAT
jgi:hypothetical protein